MDPIKEENQQAAPGKPPKRRRSLGRRLLRIFRNTLIGITLFLVFIVILLQFPFVQTWLGSQATSFLRKKFDVDVTIGRIEIRFFDKLTLKDVLVKDHHSDTLLNAEYLYVRIGALNLQKGKINMSRVMLENALFNMVSYKGDEKNNLSILIDKFKPKKEPDPNKPKKPMVISVDKIDLMNVRVNIVNENATPPPALFESNNIRISEIYGDIRGFRVSNDTISFVSEELRALEKSGLRLQNLSSRVLICNKKMSFSAMELSTEKTLLKGYYGMEYDNFKDFSDFLNKVKLHAELDISDVDMADIGYFTKNLQGMDFNLRFRGKVTGPVSHLKGKGIKLYFGTVSQFDGDFALDGLPDIDNTFIFFDLKKLVTNYYDLQTIPMPPFDEGKKLAVPVEVLRMGVLNFGGEFSGFVKNFTAYGKLNTNVGSAETDITLKQVKDSDLMTYDGTVALKGFNLGRVIANEKLLGKVSLNGRVRGTGFAKGKLKGEFTGQVSALELNQYNYQNIDVDATFTESVFTGNLGLNDQNLGLKFDGMVDITDKKRPVFDFIARIDGAHLNNLHIIKSDTIHRLSTELSLHFSGLDPDNIEGKIEVYNTAYFRDEEEFYMKTLNISSRDSVRKDISVRSDFVDADFVGKFRFKSLYNELLVRLHEVLPVLKIKPPENFKIDTNDFNYKITLKNPETLTKIFMPDLQIPQGAYMEGHYQTGATDLYMSGIFNDIRYKNLRFEKINFTADNKTGSFNTRLLCSTIYLTDSMEVDNFRVDLKVVNDSIDFSVKFKNRTKRVNSANINGKTYIGQEGQYTLDLFDTYFYFNDSLWQVNDLALLKMDSGNVRIEDLDILVGSEQRKLFSINGEASVTNPKRPMRVSFFEFPLTFFNFLLKPKGMEIAGVADGTVELYNLLKAPYFISNFSIAGLGLNNNELGDLSIESAYTDTNKVISLNTALTKDRDTLLLVKDGRIYPSSKDQMFDIEASLRNLPLIMAEPFVAPNLTDMTGTLKGSVKLTGGAENLKFQASINGSDLAMRVGYTKVYYKVAIDPQSYIQVNNSVVFLPNIRLEEPSGGYGLVRGVIRHDMFKDMKLNISVTEMRNFGVLNTTRKDNSQFYGQVYISTLRPVQVVGPMDDLFISGHIQTAKGTRLNVPLDNANKTSAAEFVTFIDKNEPDSLAISSDDAIKTATNFTVDLFARVTEEAEFRLIFDEATGDVITANGFGEFDVDMDSKGKFDLHGDYAISSGSYLFTLQNLANKRFSVKPGSRVLWDGNVANAVLDVTAIYTTNASVSPLVTALDPLNADSYRGNTKVNCELTLTQTLSNPQVKFDLDLPDADDNTRSLVQTAINTKEDRERQVFSLLILNQFLPPESLSSGGGGSSGNMIGSTATSTSLELLTGQLNNWISKVNKDFNLKLDYKQGDQVTTSDQVKVGVNYSFLNNRLILDTDLGVNSGGNEAQNATNNIVGNFNLEYKATKDGKLRLKAFNRSNENNLLKNSVPYTQGIGISYRREFDRWGDLLKKKKKSATADSLKKNNTDTSRFQQIRDSLRKIQAPDSLMKPANDTSEFRQKRDSLDTKPESDTTGQLPGKYPFTGDHASHQGKGTLPDHSSRYLRQELAIRNEE